MTLDKSHEHLTYRPDIDGLRAVAVLAVIAFHAFPEKIKGGFIGVDIFFVISGFLITSIIFQSLEENRFSFIDFYARRIRRIFPALILVLTFCYTAGWFTLLQDEFQQLGKHIAAGSIFISNFTLWDEIGYFDNSAETKVLLHLWSLGIEEQFYLIWPLLAFLAWKRHLNLLTIIFTICVLSFSINISFSDNNRVLDFFSPQTRFWELFIGSALAWITVYPPIFNQRIKIPLNNLLNKIVYSNRAQPNSNLLANFVSIIGTTLIVAGLLLITKTNLFPGWWALMPVIGSMLIILAGRSGWINRMILSNRILVWIGLISFPLYLWHWPLLSFSRILFSDTPPPLVRSGLIIVSFVFAWLTYLLIEKPIRFGHHKKVSTTILVALLISVGFVGLNANLQQGLPFRKAVINHKVNSDLLQWDSLKSKGCTQELGIESNFCIKFGDESNIKVAIIGDSTGNSIAPGLAEILKAKGMGVINLGGWTCPPILGLVETTHWGRLNKCPTIIQKTYQYLEKNKDIDTVIFSIFAADLKYLDIPGTTFEVTVNEKFAAIKPLIERSIQELTRLGKKVIVTYDAPYSTVTARDCIPRPGLNKTSHACNILVHELPDRSPNIELFESLFKDNKNVCVFNQSSLLLKNGKLNFTDDNGQLLLRDTHHLSYWGSRRMAEELITSRCLAL